jgi:endonuclease/exonuclease/phosphatase (EEP) superfamily protein YafD
MRFNFILSGLFVLLILVASLSAAAQKQAGENSVAAAAEYNGRCDLDRLVQSDLYQAKSSAAGLDPDRISILNWNIYKGQRDNWAVDFRRYSNRHDVVTIQEAHLVDQLESVLDDAHRHWTMNAAFNYQDKATGVMTASSVKPVYTCGQHTTEPLIRTPKTSLISYYPVEGVDENLLVANIHGINFSLGVAAYSEQIEKLYDLMKHHQGPVVLAGDFNTWSEKRMRIVETLAHRLSLSSLDYTNHNRTSVFGKALDHVFYRGLEPLEHDTWHVTSSDHNPTHVSFRVKNYYLNSNEYSANVIDENNC